MKALRLAPLGLLLLVGAARADAPLALPQIDHIVVRKAARAMDLYADGALVHSIAGIQLGDAPVGHKRFQGDEKTPEGRYTIDYGNPQSSYHLSLHISYPNASDSAYAASGAKSGRADLHPRPAQQPAQRACTGRLDGWLHRGER